MKTLRLLSAFIAVFLGVTFASCGGDYEPETPPVNNNLTVNYKVTITPTEDELRLCDLTFTYIDGEGKTLSEPVTGNYEKLISYTKFPCNGGFILSRVKKSDVVVGEKAKMGVDYKITRVVFNSSDVVLQTKTWLNNTHITIGGDKFDDFMAKNQNIVTRSFSMSVENGNVNFTEK